MKQHETFKMHRNQKLITDKYGYLFSFSNISDQIKPYFIDESEILENIGVLIERHYLRDVTMI